MATSRKKAPPPKKRLGMPKKRAPGKPSASAEPTYALHLTRDMLVHLRDLFGVLLPPDGQASVSQFLGVITGRKELEDELFTMVEDLCIDAEVPTGDQAPDYVVMPVSPPPMGVFEARLGDDGQDGEEPGDDKSCENCDVKD